MTSISVVLSLETVTATWATFPARSGFHEYTGFLLHPRPVNGLEPFSWTPARVLGQFPIRALYIQVGGMAASVDANATS